MAGIQALHFSTVERHLKFEIPAGNTGQARSQSSCSVKVYLRSFLLLYECKKQREKRIPVGVEGDLIHCKMFTDIFREVIWGDPLECICQSNSDSLIPSFFTSGSYVIYNNVPRSHTSPANFPSASSLLRSASLPQLNISSS